MSDSVCIVVGFHIDLETDQKGSWKQAGPLQVGRHSLRIACHDALLTNFAQLVSYLGMHLICGAEIDFRISY
jgi:hypothetical protein